MSAWTPEEIRALERADHAARMRDERGLEHTARCEQCGRFKSSPADRCDHCGFEPLTCNGDPCELNRAHGHGW